MSEDILASEAPSPPSSDGLASLTKALTDADALHGGSIGEAVLKVVPGMAEVDPEAEKMSLRDVMKHYGAAPLLVESCGELPQVG